ncbi:hypothetical protein C2E23DRAFT_886509 [Lenzites betulinus]|nr:hypothetical protein C2E23DRAFT_886509 [Lenzites betulinus]
MSHSPTPLVGDAQSPSSARDAVSRLQTLLSSVALPKSKNAKTVSVPLATFQTFLHLAEAALRSTCVEAPFSTLCTKIDSLAAQIADSHKAPSYAQVAASQSSKPAKASAPPRSVPPSVPFSEPRPPRYDFILRQLDYKHPAFAHDTPADIQRNINDILIRNNIRSQPNNPDSPIPRVRAVAKLRNGNIRLMWHNQDERDTARIEYESWLPQFSSQLEVLLPSYRVVVHGVPTDFKFDTDGSRQAALETIVRENPYLGDPTFAEDELETLQWMSRKSSPPSGKSHSSLVLFFKESANANHAIENGIALNGRLLRAERFRSLL